MTEVAASEHVHVWQPPESTTEHLGRTYTARYRPENINMRVCATCGELGWVV